MGEILLNKREIILEEWFRLIVETYPSETQIFLKTKKDPFSNPIRQAILDSTSALFDLLVRDSPMRSNEIEASLDRLIRIRATQEFTPAQAVGFVFLLKPILRKEMGSLSVALESKIDEMILIAFDLYSSCREKSYEIRSLELQKRTSRILQRAEQMWHEQNNKKGKGGALPSKQDPL